MDRGELKLNLWRHVIRDACRDMQDVHRSASQASARLESSKRMLQAYLAKADAEAKEAAKPQ